jgi:uncharacterized YccA/Bax inhibitor family protein
MASRTFKRFTKSSNPVLSDAVLQKSHQDFVGTDGNVMTVKGAVNKTFFLLLLLVFTSVISFMFPSPLFTWGGAIGGLIVVVIAVFNKEKSGLLAPIYAALEGLFVGGITFMYAAAFNGIVLHAVSLTMLVFFVMLFVHKTGIIPVTNKFRTGVVMATGAILGLYLMSWVLGMFGVNIPFLHEGGPMGILISVAILGIAALNLLLDFDLFEKGEEYGAPEYMEWFAGMSLLITLVWIYIEVLRLLSMLGRD